MELPVVSHRHHASPDEFVRAIKQATILLAETYAEMEELEGVTAFANPERHMVYDANMACDVHTPAQRTARQVYDEACAYFESRGVRGNNWISTDVDFDDEWHQLLTGEGHHVEHVAVMHLRHEQRADEPPSSDLQIVSARAVIPQYQAFRSNMSAQRWGEEVGQALGACAVDMLDETRLDMLVARRDREVIAAAGIMAAGEIGVVWDVETDPNHRRQGVMRTLLTHVFELAARSQFQAIILDCHPDNTPAVRLYESMGMREVARFQTYRHADAEL